MANRGEKKGAKNTREIPAAFAESDDGDNAILSFHAVLLSGINSWGGGLRMGIYMASSDAAHIYKGRRLAISFYHLK